MTVKLLVDWKDPASGRTYLVGNLATLDAGTETGLVAAKLADSNLTGGTAYATPAKPESVDETHIAAFSLAPDGTPTGLVGPGGGVVALPKPDGNTCVILGDSLTGQNLLIGAIAVSGELSAYNPPASYVSATNDKGYMSWLQVLSGNAFVPLFNAGVSGNRSDQILARVSSVTAYSPKWVFELSGTNDVSQLVAFYGGNGTLAETTTIANRKAIWAQLIAAGSRVVAMSIPIPSSASAWTAAQIGLVCRINRQLKDYCQQNGIFWVDITAATTDVANTTGY